MTVLLDTSPLLWTLADPDRLSAEAREAIAAGGATLSVVEMSDYGFPTFRCVRPVTTEDVKAVDDEE